MSRSLNNENDRGGNLDLTAAVLTQMIAENSVGDQFVLTATTSRTYTFDGIISNYTFGAEKVGLMTISGTFSVNGAIVIA